MILKIEKGLPIPNRNPRRKKRFKDAFDSMEVGDSFFVAADNEGIKKLRKNLSSSLGLYKKLHNPTFKVATRITNNPSGLRVWRVN